ncbi:MAG: hypothetical protein ABWZ40_12150 [Caulobacterales bacterium]
MRFGRAVFCALSVCAAASLAACATGPVKSGPGVSNGASISAAALATAQPAPAGKSKVEYADRTAMLRAADMAAFVTAAREQLAQGGSEKQPAIAIVVFADDMAAKHYDAAAAVLEAHQDKSEGIGAILSAMASAAKDDKEHANISLKLAQNSTPDRMYEIAQSSIYEAWGDLPGAAKVLETAEPHYIFRPAKPGGPKNLEAFANALAAPDALDFALRAGDLQYRMNNIAEAKRYYSLALAMTPDEIDARAALARIARGEKIDKPALTIQQAAARVYGAIADDLTKREAVAGVLGAAIAGQPPKGDEFSPSASIFNQAALLLDPNDAKRTLGLAGDMVRINETDTAVRVAQRVKDPLWRPSAQLLAAQAYLKSSKDDLAIAQANDALKAAPQDPLTLAQAGFVLGQAGQDTPSITALTSAAGYSKATEMKIAVTLTRASMHFKFGRLPQAIADARTALATAPARDDIKATLATYLVEGPGTYNEGLTILRRMLAASPDDAERMNALGYSLLSRPNTLEEGYRLLAKANAAAPFDWAIVDSIGWAYYLYGDYPAAVARLEVASAGFGDDPNPEVLDHLGDAYWRMDRKDKAKESWTKALDARPHALMADRIRAKLSKGLTTPAPTKRKPPAVDLTPPKPASPT